MESTRRPDAPPQRREPALRGCLRLAAALFGVTTPAQRQYWSVTLCTLGVGAIIGGTWIALTGGRLPGWVALGCGVLLLYFGKVLASTRSQ